MTDITDLNVEKKDGRIEDFQSAKVRGGMIYAGASAQEAETISNEVEKWALENAKDGIIKTSKIRVKVLELLKKVNPDAADAFKAYKKPE
jgi:transcriptional regulator NrdR family protein